MSSTPTPAVAQINVAGIVSIVAGSLTGLVKEVEELAVEDVKAIRAEIASQFWQIYNNDPEEVLAQFNILFLHFKVELENLNGFFTMLFGPNPNPPAAAAPAPTPPTTNALPTGSTQDEVG